jgi:hypothetical protein
LVHRESSFSASQATPAAAKAGSAAREASAAAAASFMTTYQNRSAQPIVRDCLKTNFRPALIAAPSRPQFRRLSPLSTLTDIRVNGSEGRFCIADVSRNPLLLALRLTDNLANSVVRLAFGRTESRSHIARQGSYIEKGAKVNVPKPTVRIDTINRHTEACNGPRYYGNCNPSEVSPHACACRRDNGWYLQGPKRPSVPSGIPPIIHGPLFELCEVIGQNLLSCLPRYFPRPRKRGRRRFSSPAESGWARAIRRCLRPFRSRRIRIILGH